MEENVEYFKVSEAVGYLRQQGKKGVFVNKEVVQYVRNVYALEMELTPSTKQKFDKAFHKLAYKINTQF